MAKVREEKPQTFTDYVRLVEQLQGRHDRPIWYRGSGRASYRLLPTLYRHNSITTVAALAQLENQIMTRFRQRSIPFHPRSLVDVELTKYDRYNRSTDDAESHRVRYEILKSRFRRATAKA